MTSKLKTLILPQLVEQRRQSADSQQTTITSLEGVDGTSIFLVDNASLSDITSPATPTFSQRSGLGHLRCSSSTSSLDLPLPLTLPVYAPECPVSATSPTAVAPSHSSTLLGLGNAGPKRQLADVQEEGPLERVEEENGNEERVDYFDQDIEYAEDVSREYRNSYLYGCLCDTPCTHGQSKQHNTSSPWPALPGFDHESGYPAEHEIPEDQVSPLSVRPHRTDSGASAMMVDGIPAPDSSFSGLTLRFGSRIHALSRWRSNSARNQQNNFVNLIGAPASEPSLSRAPSSRRSSLSASRRNARSGNSVDEQARFPPPLSATSHAMSFYGSTESVAHIHAPTTRKASQSSMASNGVPGPSGVGSTVLSGLMIDNNDDHDNDDDDDEKDLRRSLERERSLATTPLLPPLFISNPPPPVVSPLPPSLQTSPLQSPGLESPLPGGDISTDRLSMPGEAVPSPVIMSRLSSQDVLPSPPLQKKASTSSLFHHHGHASASSTGSAKAAPATAAPPPTLEPHDEWSDRLGHANYTIMPKPPVVSSEQVSATATPTSMDTADAKARLRELRADWSQARINYTKHLVRVGEHYGTTSTTYALTDAKWAETEREWKTAHDALLEQILAAQKMAAVDGNGSATTKHTVEDDVVSLFPPRHDVSLMVPQLIDGEGKFPHRGDEDIVGPMDRATFMVVPQNGSTGGDAGAHGGPVSTDGSRISEEKRKMAKFWKTLAGRVRLTRK